MGALPTGPPGWPGCCARCASSCCRRAGLFCSSICCWSICSGGPPGPPAGTMSHATTQTSQALTCLEAPPTEGHDGCSCIAPNLAPATIRARFAVLPRCCGSTPLLTWAREASWQVHASQHHRHPGHARHSRAWAHARWAACRNDRNRTPHTIAETGTVPRNVK